MDDNERGSWGDTRERDTRAASPLIGIILLFALVMMGAMLVFVAGSAMFDAIQSEADREQAQQFMLETDHRLSTVAETKKEQVLPNGVGPSDVTDDGRIDVAWYANGSSGDPWSDASCSTGGSLGTLEYEQAGGTIAHQGGGIWETTNGETSIVSEPNIGYDNDTLQLQILQLDNSDFGGSEAVARADHSKATDLTRRINNASTRCNDRANVAIRIESEYHDGWYRFLEDSLGEDEYKGVNVTQTGDTVEARIGEIREPVNRPQFVVAEDRGLSSAGKGKGNALKYDQRLPYAEQNPVFNIEAVIENTDEMEHTENITATIWGGDLDSNLTTSTSVTIPGNETVLLTNSNKNGTLKFKPSQYNRNLTAGETYKYIIETESGDRTDNPAGSFYFGESGDFFEMTNGSATTADGNVTIITELQNVGIETGTQNVRFELAYQDDLPTGLEGTYGKIGGKDVTRLYGESAPVGFTLNESKLLDGEYKATIKTDNGTETVLFNVTAGLEPGRVGLGGVENANVTVEVMGSQVSGTTLYFDSQTGEPKLGHQLAPMTLDIVANGKTQYSFRNSNSGTNINTAPTWQNKNGRGYTYDFTVEDETELTLRNTRYSMCRSKSTDPDTVSGYPGPSYADFLWCNDVPGTTAFGPIDASQGQNLQNVRVRTAENNTIPALPAGAAQQMSATEILQERGLIKNNGNELNLDTNEFVFLFENTADCGQDCDEDDIDALWNEAVDAYNNDPNATNDPDFNDLIVYVEVERAGVDPGKPGITIQPGGGDPTNVGTGNADSNKTGTETNDTGINVDTDSIVVG